MEQTETSKTQSIYQKKNNNISKKLLLSASSIQNRNMKLNKLNDFITMLINNGRITKTELITFLKN